MSYPVPDDESARLDSLRELNLLDTPAENRFDRITRIAKRAIDCDASAINLIDSDRQWGKSACNTEGLEAPREDSICTHAILDDGTTVIHDTHEDERLEGSPFLAEPHNIRFYMGHPVHSPEGHRIGTLCVFDTSPRGDVPEKDRRLIEDLASMVDSEIEREQLHDIQASLRDRLDEAERRSRIDELTNLWNRRAILEMFEDELNRANRSTDSLGVAMLDIDDFKELNDTHGHPAGDEVLRQVAGALREAVRDYDAVARFGGEEFLVLLTEATHEQARKIGERMRQHIDDLEVKHNGKRLTVTVSVGITVRDVATGDGSEEIIEEADRALYHSKEIGKNRVTFYSELEESDVASPC